MAEIVFQNLRMSILTHQGQRTLSISVDSGHVSFEVAFPLTVHDCVVLEMDVQRAAFLQAALHHPSQIKETKLNDAEVRNYLDTILHGDETQVETFLTQLDHGSANGAISNMMRLTCGRDQQPMRKGRWFEPQIDKNSYAG